MSKLPHSHEGESLSEKILYKDESYAIQGAIYEVYRELGAGFIEAVYHECLEKELALRQIPFQSHPKLTLTYKGHELRQTYIPDFICFNSILIELKAVQSLASEHRAQVHNYLKATRLRLGLLVNFGHYPKATVERVIM